MYLSSIRVRLAFALLACGALILGIQAIASAQPSEPAEMVVGTAWLAERLDDDDLVLLHVGNREQYDAEHIPGAQYVGLSMISVEDEGLVLQMPPVEQLEEAFEALGVSDASRIVVYMGNNWTTPTARVYLTLEYLGLGDRTSILDGGMNAWKADGQPTTAEASTAERGDFTPHPREDVVASADFVASSIEAPGVAIIDARTANFYSGSRAGHGMPRAGHIPGAGNIPFLTITDDETLKLKDRETLEAMFESAGAEPGDLIITYCHIGQQASLVYFAARYLGYDARMYDGSFQEWSNLEDQPVVNPSATSMPKVIETAELAALLESEQVSVIDMRSSVFEYMEGHIPGAAYLHYETLRATKNGVPADLLSGDAYAELFSGLGISMERPVVIYADGAKQNFNATFLAHLLGGFGHPKIRVLDGGFAKWTAEGRPTSRDYPEIEATEFAAEPFDPHVGSLRLVKWVVEHAGTPDGDEMVLVDVRPTSQYAGEAGAQKRRGHIPGAINHVWSSDLVSAGEAKVWKPVDELRASYESQGITPDKHVILYCNTGTEASHAYFTLHSLLGYANVDVYIPSFTEWAEREDLPIVAGR